MPEITPEISIFFSCSSEKYVSDENLIPEHGITHIYEGELKVNDGTETIILNAGDTAFCSRHYLLRFTKLASPEKPLKSVAIAFSQPFLQDFYAKNQPQLTKDVFPKALFLDKNLLWENYFQSLKPYLDLQTQLPAELNELKRLEALGILRTLHRGIDNILSNFNGPGKIDLKEFMQKNYLYNLPQERFAYLTGRSLATFKRDFQRIFDNSPQRWLTMKRLELAHYLIAEKKLRPSDAYIESGFENFSHFSFAFKNQFGYSPS